MSSDLRRLVVLSDPLRELCLAELRDVLDELLSGLTFRQRGVIVRRFGLNGEPKLTFDQLGRFYGLTRKHIRNIQTSAINKLRQKWRLVRLAPFYFHSGDASVETLFE